LTKKTLDLLIKLGIEVAEWISFILREKKKGNRTGKNGNKKEGPGNEPKKS